MKILVACEESQAVTIELRRLGHETYSCDLLECSGGHPEWHIQGDVLKILNPSHHQMLTGSTPTPLMVDHSAHIWRGITFHTMDGKLHIIDDRWDMIIAFPPCTFLTNTGNRWFDCVKYGKEAQKRWDNRCEAICFFLSIAYADCDKIIIENPIGCMSRYFRKPDQIIHPYYFAEYEDDINCERKATCLWLKGVEPLKYTIQFEPRVVAYKNGKGTDSPWHMETMKLPSSERSRARSKTYPGIAKAMAEQLAGESEGL